MKVIFVKDLKGQGKKNEIKEVSDGYGVNFLIKNGYAVKYTKTSSEILSTDLKNKEKEDNIRLNEARELKSKLEKEEIIYKVAAGKDGKTFGSISNKQIAESLKDKGYNIDKKSIKINEPLTKIGNHFVNIELYKKEIAKLKVTLIQSR